MLIEFQFVFFNVLIYNTKVMRFVFVLIFMLVPVFAFAQDDFEAGKVAFYKADYYNAQKLFLKELQRNPNNYSCRYFLAHTYVYNDEVIKAKQEYSKIITFAPNKSLQKLAMQSMYNLNNVKTTKDNIVPNISDGENYYDSIKLDGNYVKWKNFPITVYVEPGNYSYLVKNAFANWQKASGGFVKFEFVGNINSAQIKVFMVDKLSNISLDNYESGVAVINAKNNIIYNADIKLLEFDAKTGERLSDDVIYATSLHEVGHALGLQGHSPNSNDIMSAIMNKTSKVISKRDLNTLKMLYSLK